MLPRFASEPHKDTRAPQNLYPIGGLERELRHRLGDQALLFRSLQRARQPELALAVVAGSRDLAHLSAQVLHVPYASIDTVEHDVESPPLRRARRVAVVVRVQRVDDLVEREPERLKAAGEHEPVNGRGGIGAIPRRSALGRGQHASSLVEAHGVDAHTRALAATSPILIPIDSRPGSRV